MKKYLAIDLGASSGRGILGKIEDDRLILKEQHRFSNDPVETSAGFFWDTLRLLFEIKTAIAKCAAQGGLDSIGIDTWGVDYAYIDSAGVMLSPSYQYRDQRTIPMMDQVYGKIPYDTLYKITGIESMSFNTIFQLQADLANRPWLLDTADKLLLTPDLLGYFLTGNMAAEYTIASTTALLNAAAKKYDGEVLRTLGIRENLFPPVVHPGNVLGRLHEKIDADTGKTGATVINVCSHDTASAVLAVPAEKEDFLYISSGTWSLMGIESDHPLITSLSQRYSFTNEGGAFGKINVMKNIMGLWLIQESRRQWKREGKEYTFDEISAAALAAAPFRSLIDPDDPVFSPAGDMPGRIREYCHKTGQPVPEDMGAVARCIFESLALRYRWTAERLEELSGKKYGVINIVGGGTKDSLLCQFTADGTGRTVHAGPVEATAIGNIMMQAYAAGEVGSCEEIRRTVRNSFDVKVYMPDVAVRTAWDDAYTRFCKLADRT